jgi:hypothetical protein
LTRFNQAHQFQASNRVSNGTAAYLKNLRQLAFRGQFISGFQFLKNQAFDLLGDFFVDLVSSDNLEVGFGGFDGRRHGQVVW